MLPLLLYALRGPQRNSFNLAVSSAVKSQFRSLQAYYFKIFGPLTPNLLTTTIVAPPSNASKWQMGFNSAFKGLMCCEFWV